MKNLTDEQIDSFLDVVGNDVNGSLAKLPSNATPLEIKDIKKEKYEIRNDESDPNKITSQGDWVKVTFEDGGSLSLKGILRSPDLEWHDSLDTNKKRIKALSGSKLHFTYQESKTSKRNQPYKVTHFVKQVIGATSGK